MSLPTGPSQPNALQNPDQVPMMIYRDPLEVLKQLGFGEIIERSSKNEQAESIPPTQVELIIKDIRSKTAQLLHLELLTQQEAGSGDELAAAGLTEQITLYKELLRRDLTAKIEKFGMHLSWESRRIYRFNEEPDFDPQRIMNPPTFANFRAASMRLREAMSQRQQQRAFFAGKAASGPFGKIPGLETISQQLLKGPNGPDEKIERLRAALHLIWNNDEVRMAYINEQHQENVAQIHEGRAIVETPTVTVLLNRIHEGLFGSKAYKVAGPALVGPPGWGKTSLLQDYFRSFGLEALSADIDPGQSSFSLMARPTLGVEKNLGEIKALLDFIDGLSNEQVQKLIEVDTEKFKMIFGMDIPEGLPKPGMETEENAGKDNSYWQEVKGKMKKSLEEKMLADFMGSVENLVLSKGYAYCLILKGLQQNQPVILNEFPELREWTFLHGLLTAVPCSDEDAAPRPSGKPKEGEEIKNPKGWFFNTITGDWMRVGKNFRICFTGNIGIEYGNTGVPPALMSRIGSNLIQVEGLPPEEIARCIMWPLLSSKETGFFLLDEKTAYKLHFIVTQFLPKLQEKLKVIGDETFTVSNRLIIDLCRAMHPVYNETPCDLEEALMRTMVRPCHALRFQESLKFIVAMLIGTGLLRNPAHLEEIKGMDKDLGSERTKAMIDELKNPFKEKTYEEDKENFEGKCPVCAVKNCPVHGKDARSFEKFSDRAAEIAKMGLDMRILELVGGFLNKLLASGQYGMYIEAHIGNAEQDKANRKISAEDREKIETFVAGMIQAMEKNPDTAAEHIHLVVEAVKKHMYPKAKISSDVLMNLNTAAEKKLQENYGKAKTHGEKTDAVKRYLKVKTGLYKIGRKPASDKTKEILKEFIGQNDDLEIFSLAKEIFDGEMIVHEPLKIASQAKKDAFTEQLDKLKKEIFTAQPVTQMRSSKTKVSAGIMQTPEFEILYPKLIKFLDMAYHMLNIGYITIRDGQEIIGLIESKMNQVVRFAQTPKAFTPYIRVIKKLAQMKRYQIDEAVAELSKPSSVPMPPVRQY